MVVFELVTKGFSLQNFLVAGAGARHRSGQTATKAPGLPYLTTIYTHIHEECGIQRLHVGLLESKLPEALSNISRGFHQAPPLPGSKRLGDGERCTRVAHVQDTS